MLSYFFGHMYFNIMKVIFQELTLHKKFYVNCVSSACFCKKCTYSEDTLLKQREILFPGKIRRAGKAAHPEASLCWQRLRCLSRFSYRRL